MGADPGVTEHSKEIPEILLAAQPTGSTEHPLIGVLDEILGVLK
jgi:hypothetical protein